MGSNAETYRLNSHPSYKLASFPQSLSIHCIEVALYAGNLTSHHEDKKARNCKLTYHMSPRDVVIKLGEKLVVS